MLGCSCDQSCPHILMTSRQWKLDRGCPNGTNTPRGDNFSGYQNLHCDLDLWPFDLKIYRAHPWLMGSLHVKFHDDRCKGKAVMRRKPFSVIYALWPWPLDLKIYGAHPCLMGSLHVKFHDDRCKGKACSYAPETIFSNLCIVTLTFDLWTSKSIGHILASWGVCMWSFMMIGVKGKQLCAGNHFQ